MFIRSVVSPERGDKEKVGEIEMDDEGERGKREDKEYLGRQHQRTRGSKKEEGSERDIERPTERGRERKR